jgi:hypothetical protein
MNIDTKIGTPEREHSLGFLDKFTDLKRKYIIKKLERSKP